MVLQCSGSSSYGFQWACSGQFSAAALLQGPAGRRIGGARVHEWLSVVRRVPQHSRPRRCRRRGAH